MLMNNKNYSFYIVYVMWSLFFIMIFPSMYCMMMNFNLLMEWNLLSSLSVPIMMTLVMDNTSLMYSTVVIFISANVLMFSTMYMMEDKFINRFTMLVLTFIVSMNMLIYIPHMIILLIGWDGLGITSFILVIYYQNPKSLAAGLITALTNRIGDVAILLSIAWTMKQGMWNIMYMDINNQTIWQILAITIASMTKSAQMPFSSWLPAAMAAPTPVSALVHSSTLVTAGVFLVIRFYPFLSSNIIFNKIMLFMAVSTMIMAGISAMTECDMKKIIALSTLSQLGMMMTSIGLGFPQMTFIHMIIHALFKALLFICAGNLINQHAHAQDLRWMGNISKTMPITSSCMLISNMALCGIPYMSGFYSKDMIIETSMYYNFNIEMVIFIILSVYFTSLYSMRMMTITVWGPRLHKVTDKLTESMMISIPMLLMCMMSIIMGSVIMWLIPNINQMIELPLYLKTMTLVMVLFGLVSGLMISYLMSQYKSNSMKMMMNHMASCSMWFLVPLSSQYIMSMPLQSSHLMLKIIDQSWLENSSGQGMYSNIMKQSSKMLMYSPLNPNMLLFMPIISMFMFWPVMIN